MKIKTAIFASFILIVGMLAFGAANLRFMTGLDISPASPGTGDTITCSVTWKAQNDDAVNVRIIGGIDSMTIYDTTFPLVPAGETRTISFTWTGTTGSHKAWFHMDPDELTGDPYPENNYIEKIFTVGSGGSGTVIISVTTLTVTEKPYKLTPDKFCELSDSKSIDLTITKFKVSDHPTDKYMKTLNINIKNNGQKCVPTFRFQVHDSSGLTVRNIEVNPKPGKNYALYGNDEIAYGLNIHTSDFLNHFKKCKAKVKIPGDNVNTPVVTKTANAECNRIKVIVDPLNTIPESNENNNVSQIETIIWQYGVTP